MQSPQSISGRCRSLREEKGWSQRELGRRLGKSQATIARLEAGQLDHCFATINAMADALGVSCCELVGCIDG